MGEGLQDHLQVRSVYRCTQPLTLNDDPASWRGRLQIAWRYVRHRRGPLTVSAGYAGAFLRSSPELSVPDVQLLFITFSTQRMGDRLDSFSGFTVSACPLRPESRGYVRLVSADPRDPSAIRANYLSTQGDRETCVAAMRLVRNIMAQRAMSNFAAAEVAPCSQSSDTNLLAYAQATGASLYHPSCSVQMGGDPIAPLDPALRVRGIEH